MTKICSDETVVAPWNGWAMTKVERYGWSMSDGPGEFRQINKSELSIDHAYQRDKVSQRKVKEIASNWSWRGCGCILVSCRSDGSLWVFDGQHRVLAARKRSDIDALPCLVFNSDSIKSEASGFLSANAERKPISAFDKFRAMVITDDDTCRKVREIFDSLGVCITSNPSKAKELKCVSQCIELARTDIETFEFALSYAIDVCGDEPIHRDILRGLFYLDYHHDLFSDSRFPGAISKVSRLSLVESMKKFAVAQGVSTPKILGQGILKVLNHGRKNKFCEVGGQ